MTSRRIETDWKGNQARVSTNRTLEAKLGALWAAGWVAALAWVLVLAMGTFQVGRPFAGFLVDPTLSVLPLSRSVWSGPPAGGLPDDFVLKADGRPLEDDVAFRKAIEGKERVAFEVLRGGKTALVMVPIGEFSWADYLFVMGPLSLAGLGHLAIGSMTLRMRPRLAGAQALMLMAAAISINLALQGDWFLAHRLPYALPFALPIIGVAFLWMAKVFPTPLTMRRSLALAARIGPLAALLALWAFGVAIYHPGGHAAGRMAFDHLAAYQSGVGLFFVLGGLCLLSRLAYAAIQERDLRPKRQAQVTLCGLAVAYGPDLALFLQPWGPCRAAGSSALHLVPPYSSPRLWPMQSSAIGSSTSKSSSSARPPTRRPPALWR